jgi:ketosteroid isomerase-like protein
MRTFRLLALAIATAALACRPAAPPDTSAEAKQAIDAANANWARLTAAGHADSIAEFYTTDAVIMPPNMSTTRGRDAIRTFFATMNELKPTLAIHAEAVTATGTNAVEMGRWTFTWPANTPRPPGAPAVDSGKYMVHWVSENGHWLMKHDIWNSDLPMPQPAAAPAAAPRR